LYGSVMNTCPMLFIPTSMSFPFPQQACIISLKEVTESRHDTFQSRLLTLVVPFLSLVDMLQATGGGFGT
jgi:hypothetical protein